MPNTTEVEHRLATPEQRAKGAKMIADNLAILMRIQALGMDDPFAPRPEISSAHVWDHVEKLYLLRTYLNVSGNRELWDEGYQEFMTTYQGEMQELRAAPDLDVFKRFGPFFAQPLRATNDPIE
jgi:hypothetical protein